jgi:large subunit ribosomal protein L11
MAFEIVEAMVEGGKASAAPPLGPALGPLGVNIAQVITKVNEKTASFKGMQVPIKIKVDKDTKDIEIEVGTPPVSALVKKEAGLEKGSGNPLMDKVADLRIENIIKIAKMKEDDIMGKTLKQRVKEVMGTCNSMGVMVDGVSGQEAIALVNEGKFDKEIAAEKTEISLEELREMEAEKKKLAEDMVKRRAEFEAKAKAIIEEMAGKEKSAIKKRMEEVGIPGPMIKELMPADAKDAKGGAPAKGAAPAAGAKAAAPAAAKPAGKK